MISVFNRKRVSQKQTVLGALRRAGRRGLTTGDLINICPAEYRARISDARNDGYEILGEREYKDGRYLGYWRYYLISESEEMAD